MIYHFILNPKSGRNKKFKNIEDSIKSACCQRQLSYHIYYTTCPGDATEYVSSMMRISQERQRFICIGGDGTLSEIVNSSPENTNAEFGVIPSGSGNDFVRNFTHRELFLDIEAQIDGETVSLDLIKCNETYSVNMINIGFDCAVAKEAARLKKKWFANAKTSYNLGLVKTFFKKIGTKMRIIFDDGEVWDDVFTLTAIGNGRFCGGGYAATPEAIMNDGIMDVCSIKKISRFTFIKLVKSYKKGQHLTDKNIGKILNYKRVSHFKMSFESPEPICIDGEIKGAKNIDFAIIPNGFNFVIPKGSQFKLDK